MKVRKFRPTLSTRGVLLVRFLLHVHAYHKAILLKPDLHSAPLLTVVLKMWWNAIRGHVMVNFCVCMLRHYFIQLNNVFQKKRGKW
jgi:hypothetical protein